MKEIVLLIVGSVLTQSVQELSKDPEVRKQEKQIRQEKRKAKKQDRIYKRVLKLQAKLQSKE
jgi:uncharacterized protein YlxW (UPF0749 family)